MIKIGERIKYGNITLFVKYFNFKASIYEIREYPSSEEYFVTWNDLNRIKKAALKGRNI